MRTYVLALLCGTIFAPVAQAADLPVKAPPRDMITTYNWGGFYIGGNVGYAHSHVRESNVSGSVGGGVGTLATPDASFNDNGFTGGGQVGYNWQHGTTVVGIEADFNSISSKVDNSFLVDQGPFNATTFSDSVKTDWFSTVRGRWGYAFGNFLPYVTGGLAVEHVKARLTLNGTFTGAHFPLSFDASESKTLLGYAVGVGAEYRLGWNWSVKAEYLHMGFGNPGFDLNGNIVITGFGNIPLSSHGNVDSQFDIVRVGANYRFN